MNCGHSCPCFEECPTGCDGCMTPFCSCHDYLSNPDYIACERQAEVGYNRCLIECPTGDFLCIAACNREYESTLEDCPCQKNCPSGCPCPDYQCTDQTTTVETTTTAPSKKTSVLVLSSKTKDSVPGGQNIPLIIDAHGRNDNNFLFRFDEDTAVVSGSCSLTYQNMLYIFGGKGSNYRQISMLIGCQLRRIGSLDFDHSGACTTVANARIYLCFNGNNEADFTKCRYANDPLGVFTDITSSVYPHNGSPVAASEG